VSRLPSFGIRVRHKGVAVGVFFGLVFGGAKGRWLDTVIGPEEPAEGENERNPLPLSLDAEQAARARFGTGCKTRAAEAFRRPDDRVRKEGD
jgi:hypothetical protein